MTIRRTDDLLRDQEFPLTTEELLERCGSHEIELQNGSERLSDVLARTGDETYETADEACLALYGGLSEDAVGRVGYSDRDPTPPGAREGHEPVSF